MSNYIRVVPRDLFNEAKLLKCLGMLYLASEREPNGTLLVEHVPTRDEREGWDIRQDENSGGISCVNVQVTLRGHLLHCYTPLNSRRPHPLYAELGDKLAEVFDEGGKLTEEFLSLAPEA